MSHDTFDKYILHYFVMSKYSIKYLIYFYSNEIFMCDLREQNLILNKTSIKLFDFIFLAIIWRVSSKVVCLLLEYFFYFTI